MHEGMHTSRNVQYMENHQRVATKHVCIQGHKLHTVDH